MTMNAITKEKLACNVVVDWLVIHVIVRDSWKNKKLYPISFPNFLSGSLEANYCNSIVNGYPYQL